MKSTIDQIKRRLDRVEWMFAIVLFFTLSMTLLSVLPRIIEWENNQGIYSVRDTQSVIVERLPK